VKSVFIRKKGVYKFKLSLRGFLLVFMDFIFIVQEICEEKVVNWPVTTGTKENLQHMEDLRPIKDQDIREI
jgi:hypothetical protein